MTIGLTARVVRGLEWVAAEEISSTLTASHIDLGAREVSFTLPTLVSAVTGLTTVDDVFVRVGVIRGVGRDRRAATSLARSAEALDLRRALDDIDMVRNLPQQPAFDVVASIAGERRFNRFDVEDALGEVIGPVLGGRYGSRRAGRPPPSDLTLRIVISDDRAEILLRVALRPLHRRAWKRDTAAATLHPPVAAALIRLAGPVGTLIDPFCGDGTIPIEAACSDDQLDARGSDIDPGRLQHARANALRASAATVLLARADAAAGPWRAPGGAWVTNPPWNRTVRAEGGVSNTLSPAFTEARRQLGPNGILAAIADASVEVDAAMRSAGWRAVLAQQARLVGRVCLLVVAVPAGADRRDPVSASLRYWRDRASKAGVLTETGF